MVKEGDKLSVILRGERQYLTGWPTGWAFHTQSGMRLTPIDILDAISYLTHYENIADEEIRFLVREWETQNAERTTGTFIFNNSGQPEMVVSGRGYRDSETYLVVTDQGCAIVPVHRNMNADLVEARHGRVDERIVEYRVREAFEKLPTHPQPGKLTAQQQAARDWWDRNRETATQQRAVDFPRHNEPMRVPPWGNHRMLSAIETAALHEAEQFRAWTPRATPGRSGAPSF
ncbi:MAG: hypothetical protein HOQ05_10715 [Corynebacteriales bacterium]|nr:hypothetical protein [Mycobacteriales bacterium]